MFTVDHEELNHVREALQADRSRLGVGVLNRELSKIVLRPFDELPHRGGHLELIRSLGWTPEECLGFIVARPAHECIMINLSQINIKDGPLFMPASLFRNIVLSLRQSWAGMATSASPG